MWTGNVVAIRRWYDARRCKSVTDISKLGEILSVVASTMGQIQQMHSLHRFGLLQDSTSFTNRVVE